METPLFVPRDPHIFTVQPGAPTEGRIFVADESRWYERLKDDNGDAYYVHIADSDTEFQFKLERDQAPAAVELDPADRLAAIMLDEFMQTGCLYAEVPEISGEGIAQAAGL